MTAIDSASVEVKGYDVVKKIEAVGSSSGKTLATVTISDCGKVE